MTDRELLERAAKAAGIEELGYELMQLFGVKVWAKKGNAAYIWNPLTDDGDALRLAVKLHLTIDRSEIEDAAFVYCDWQDAHVETIEKHGNDPYAATRRAIVRAAAEIGRNMK